MMTHVHRCRHCIFTARSRKSDRTKEAVHMYHERQALLQCGVHCLNNLLQERWVSREQLDHIADALLERDRALGAAPALPLSHPYRSIVPYIGFYDIGVLVSALEERSLSIAEHFVSPSQLTLDRLEESSKDCVGLIINMSVPGVFLRLRHWLAVARIGERFVNVDSKLEAPYTFNSIKHVHDFLHDIMQNQAAQVFVVVRASVPTSDRVQTEVVPSEAQLSLP